jgi:hypothetical protein
MKMLASEYVGGLVRVVVAAKIPPWKEMPPR